LKKRRLYRRNIPGAFSDKAIEGIHFSVRFNADCQGGNIFGIIKGKAKGKAVDLQTAVDI
jgi:hypothetical protein